MGATNPKDALEEQSEKNMEYLLIKILFHGSDSVENAKIGNRFFLQGLKIFNIALG